MPAFRNTRFASGPPTPPVRWPVANSALSSVYLIVQQLANVLSAIGALLMVLRRKFSVITWQVGLLAVAAVLLLTVIKLSATVADFYNWQRALLQAQMVLAITLCWPLQLLDGRRKWHHDSILAIGVAFFTVILICTSGLANVALGGGALGGGTNINLASSGEAFNRYYVTASGTGFCPMARSSCPARTAGLCRPLCAAPPFRDDWEHS